MDRDTEALTPFMRRVRSQAEVLVPLLRHLRAELGEAKANELVYPALRDAMKKWIAELASSDSDNPVENFRKTSDVFEAMYDGDVEYETLRDDGERWDFDVSGCRYADFFGNWMNRSWERFWSARWTTTLPTWRHPRSRCPVRRPS